MTKKLRETKIVVLIFACLTTSLMNGQAFFVDTFQLTNLSKTTREIKYSTYDEFVIDRTFAQNNFARHDSPESLLAALRIAFSYKDELSLYRTPIVEKLKPRDKGNTHYNLLRRATDQDLTFRLLGKIQIDYPGRSIAYLKYSINDFEHGFRYIAVKSMEKIDSKWYLINDPPLSAIPFVLLNFSDQFIGLATREGSSNRLPEIIRGTCIDDRTLDFDCLKTLYLESKDRLNQLKLEDKPILNILRSPI